MKQRHHRTEGRVEDVDGDPSLLGPSTIARARNLLLVVNANFDGAATATQFTVSGLDRRAVKRGGDGHRGHGKDDDDHGDRRGDDDRRGGGGGDRDGGDRNGGDRNGGDDNGGGSSGHR